MNNRLTIQDLAGLLAEYTGKDKNSTERFLREFIAVVSEGVYTDKLVKVKGLGTFKIIPVEKRESIHVNTGERFVIPEHYKFSFLPDKELRELVNKPFSFLKRPNWVRMSILRIWMSYPANRKKRRRKTNRLKRLCPKKSPNHKKG